MQVPAFALRVCEPFAHRFGLVGRHVVQDDVDVEMSGSVQVYPFEEPQHVFAGVAFTGLVQHLPGGYVERGEQVDGAVALVVVGERAAAAADHRQRRLGPVQCLYLGLLVEAEHHSALRRVQIQADNVTELGLEIGIGRQFEHIGFPRTQPMLAPHPRHDGSKTRSSLAG